MWNIKGAFPEEERCSFVSPPEAVPVSSLKRPGDQTATDPLGSGDGRVAEREEDASAKSDIWADGWCG